MKKYIVKTLEVHKKYYEVTLSEEELEDDSPETRKDLIVDKVDLGLCKEIEPGVTEFCYLLEEEWWTIKEIEDNTHVSYPTP